MTTEIRLMIFGLPRGTPRERVHELIEPCRDDRLVVNDVPGDNDQAMAIVHLGHNHHMAARLSQRLSRRRLSGRALAPWLTALPWD